MRTTRDLVQHLFLTDSKAHWILIQPSSEVYASRCHEVSSNLTRSTGREHWALMEFGITCGRWMNFARYQVFWLLYFRTTAFLLFGKKMNRPFLPWQVCLEVPSWESLVLRHSQQVHLLLQRFNLTKYKCFSIALACEGLSPPKMNPKFSPIEVFRAPQAAQLLAQAFKNGHFELHVPCLWTFGPPKYPFRISDGRGQALHTQTQVPQQQIGWRPISISCAKTRKSSLRKPFKAHKLSPKISWWDTNSPPSVVTFWESGNTQN